MDELQVVNDIRSRDDLVRFIQELSREARAGGWENKSLPDFLEGLAAWTDDMDGYYENYLGEAAPVTPTWKTFAEMLAAARIYE